MTRAYALPSTSPAPQGLRRWLLAASLALAGLAPALPTLAQPAPAAADGRRAYQIPAGPLTETLNAFGLAAGVPLGGAMPLTQGKTSPGLSGRYTVPEALTALLAGSGLAATRTPDGHYVLQQASGPATLAPIAVVGAAARDAGAFVARASGSAFKSDTPLMETPRSVSVVTRAQMDTQH